MAINKIYTVFISSAFEHLRDERKVVIDTLLDRKIMPICMEHFTVSSNREFRDLEDLIDDSDIFIMLLGNEYGSCDDNGISWTQREYIYAKQKDKICLALICTPELAALLKNKKSTTEEAFAALQSENEERYKQFCFAAEVPYCKEVSEPEDIRKAITQFIDETLLSRCVGWKRLESSGMTEEMLQQWREEHEVYILAGNWHHVHLNDDDPDYIRIGTVSISQDFSPDCYGALTLTGKNYDPKHYVVQKDEMVPDTMKCSNFSGEYTLKENGQIFGIFHAKRTFKGTFDSKIVEKKENRGIHDFTIDVYADKTTFIEGEFHDEAPSPKHGRLFLFRDPKERNSFLLENRGDNIKQV